MLHRRLLEGVSGSNECGALKCAVSTGAASAVCTAGRNMLGMDLVDIGVSYKETQ